MHHPDRTTRMCPLLAWLASSVVDTWLNVLLILTDQTR
jgi:hypothetical protein